ncbi:hypothetical protein Daus18300_004258 [Diaporthe australafricana]|uniref:Heterokaryon incompatibility domain-containing protein n=1 Tax=Diaporthe australafricana TaxID=127596 RepID=A0ABR3XAK8_9PEZI
MPVASNNDIATVDGPTEASAALGRSTSATGFFNLYFDPALGLTIAKIIKLQSAVCELCRALSALSGITEDETLGRELREFPLIKRWDWYLDPDVPSFMAVVPWGEKLDKRKKLYEAGSKRGRLICCPRIEEGKPQLFSPQMVDRRFDPEIIMSWLSACDTHHPSCSASEGRETAPDVRFINCQTRSIVLGSILPFAPDYVALSYVWGIKTVTKAAPEARVKPDDVLPEDVPAVIADAIKVTLALGFKYLWVDKYCIDQNNQATKHKQIIHMGAIYRYACLTIIAAAGSDESAGLPGVTQDRQPRQTCIQTDELSITSTLPSPAHQIIKSKWASRAWIFQEAILSRRRLVFTKDQLYFECDSMHCYESLSVSFDMLYTRNSRHSYEHTDFIKPELFGFGHQKAGIRAYIDYAEEYSTRSLSFDEDSLNAFTGVSRSLETSRVPPVRNIWGVPFLHPRDVVRPNYDYLQMLMAGLSWRHKTIIGSTPRRRHKFPSWSWAGWAGSVVWPPRSSYIGILKEDAPTWVDAVRLQLEDGSTARIFSDLDFQTDDQALGHPRALFLDTVALRRDALAFDQSTDTLRLQSGGDLKLYPSKGELTAAKAFKRLQSGQYEAIRLVTLDNDVYLLLVKRHHSSYYRIGLITTKSFFMLQPHTDDKPRTFKLR